MIKAVNHNIGINKFLFEGFPGTGKTEAAKYVARLLDRTLFCVDFNKVNWVKPTKILSCI